MPVLSASCPFCHLSASKPGRARPVGRNCRAGVCVVGRTIAWVANALISLIARGALFLKETPWSYAKRSAVSSESSPICCMTYALVHVDGVLAGDHVGDSRALGLALGLLGRHSDSSSLAGVVRSIFESKMICWGDSRECSDRGYRRNYVLRRRLDLVHSGVGCGVEESSIWLGFDKPTSGNFALVFPRILRKCGPARARSPRVIALKWNGSLHSKPH